MTFRHTLVPKCSPDLVGHLVGQLGPGVVHGEDDGRDVELRVEVGRDQVDVAHELAQTLEGVVLALDGDEHLVGRRQGVDRDQARATADSR